ncbi:MAG: hypothetical protein JO115_14650 [Pseudonocardiales bacterium]|nr:hypothetical protein [Pseudonocardiales bacterium]
MSTHADPGDPAISEDLRLDKDVRARLRAVVLDANAYGRGRPNLASLTALAARLRSVGIQTWVPEPVAWEWAQHLAGDWAEAVAGAERNNGRLRGAGLEPLTSPYADENAVVEAFLDTLAATSNVTIVPLTGESAMGGLRDQILQRGPATSKGGTKTGASDSAWLRDVIAAAGASTEPLLLVSEDKALVRACQEWGFALPVMRTLAQLRATLFDVELDTGDASWIVLRYLAANLPGDLGIDGSLPIGNTSDLVKAIADDPEGWPESEVTGARLTRLTAVAGIEKITVEQADVGEHPDEHEPVTRTVMATVYFLAEGTASVTLLHGDHPVYRYTPTYQGLLIAATLAFELADQRVTAVRAEQDARVFLPESAVSDPLDALSALQDALLAVPGLRWLPEGWTADHCGELEFLVEVPGVEDDRRLTVRWSCDEELHASIQLGDGLTGHLGNVELTTDYDSDAFIMHGDDGYPVHAYPPHRVVVTGDRLELGNPVWSIAVWIIAKLTQS